MAISRFRLMQARREGLSTYLPSPAVLFSGALAAFAVIMLPFWMWLGSASLAFLDRLSSYDNPAFARMVFRMGMAPVAQYMAAVLPYIVLYTLAGIGLAWLRRNRGLYYREIPWRPYEKRLRLPCRVHRLLTYIAGPIVLMGMAYYADASVYPVVLRSNFALWLSAGAVALIVWEAVMDLLLLAGMWLRLLPRPGRRLDMELELKEILTADPTLGAQRLYNVAVMSDGSARVAAELSLPLQHRVHELAAIVKGISSVEIVPPTAINNNVAVKSKDPA